MIASNPLPNERPSQRGQLAEPMPTSQSQGSPSRLSLPLPESFVIWQQEVLKPTIEAQLYRYMDHAIALWQDDLDRAKSEEARLMAHNEYAQRRSEVVETARRHYQKYTEMEIRRLHQCPDGTHWIPHQIITVSCKRLNTLNNVLITFRCRFPAVVSRKHF
ncbi:hypothetical protein BDP27DRAFT_557895 [Rhodocollybia butyracea]|uniref:Uncharacterized protein n=1 Tax=Rhodocollybia butyracea TaxID=206335 RepID=A0A9P5PAG0_9AGAR|nr:hypothetical protein BDP27DRAFT_557895 [Rhodocollybia butyracea]